MDITHLELGGWPLNYCREAVVFFLWQSEFSGYKTWDECDSRLSQDFSYHQDGSILV